MTKWFALTVTALFCALASAQTAQPILQPEQHFVDLSGNPCAGCSLFSYQAGTTTPLATYKDASEAAQNPNPVVLNPSGAAAIWVGSAPYKFVLEDTFGTILWTVDDVTAPIPGADGPFLPLTGGTLSGELIATYFQFASNANACSAGEFVSGWNAGGWICSAPSLSGAAGGDLSGTYPNPTVAKINGLAVPVSASLLGTNSSGQPISQTGTIANNTSGNAATATALATTPAQCSGATPLASGIQANGDANCTSSTAPAFTGTSGYQQLPSGLVIEWGVSSTFDTGPTSQTLPFTFPHACLWASASDNIASSSRRIWAAACASGSSITLKNDGLGQGNWMAVGW